MCYDHWKDGATMYDNETRKGVTMKLIGITRTVANLASSKQFYEEVLGFEQDAFFEQTNWQSYKCQDGVFFAVGEKPGSTDEIAFGVAQNSKVGLVWRSSDQQCRSRGGDDPDTS